MDSNKFNDNSSREWNYSRNLENFVNPEELRGKPYVEVECQTYIQNVHKVHIAKEYINEATQTFYIGKQFQVSKTIEDVISTMEKKNIPILKIGQISQTIITFDRDYSEHVIVEQLFNDITKEHKNSEIVLTVSEDEVIEIDVWHSLNNVIDRAFWISDLQEPKIKVIDAEIQTNIKCNSITGKAISDQETQTILTCKPKVSNTKLLSDYLEKKDIVRSSLEDCLARGVYHRIIVNDIVEELINKCSLEIKFPLMNKSMQTLATCKNVHDKDENVLRKLRLEVLLDSLEMTIVVIPVMDDVLKAACIEVSQNAKVVVRNIICNLMKKSLLIASKLEEIQKQSKRKLMDHIFIQRKRRLAQLKRKNPETETSTQTKLAGVPEIKNLNELIEARCLVCTKESECRWCYSSQEKIKQQKELQILRTQDILLTYRPCFFRSTPVETKVHYLQPAQVSKHEKKSSELCSQNSISEFTPSDSFKINKPAEHMNRKIASASGWSDVTDLLSSKAWSAQDFESTSEKSSSKISLKTQNNLSPQAAKAFRILKSAFCTPGTCSHKTRSPEKYSDTFPCKDKTQKKTAKSA